MTDERTHHIADDDELLGRYVLGALDGEERRAIEAHIAGCDACAAAVRRERLIAAGVRRLGRDQVKRRLREKAGHDIVRPVLWPKIVSAAALLGVLVGAGIYYDWLGSANGPVTTDRARQDFAQGDRGKIEPPALAAPPHGRDEEKTLADARRGPESATHPVPAAEGAKRDLRADAPSPSRTEGDLAGAQPSAAGIARENESAAKQEAAPSAAFWTEGTPLGNTEAIGGAVAADRVSAESEMMKKEIDTKSKTVNQLKAPAAQKRSAAGNYQINQAPSSALPAARQVVQQRNAGGGVQTLVQQQGDVTTMTLYLDSLVDPVAVKNASVEPASDDSVVVNLGKQRIGYRLRKAK